MAGDWFSASVAGFMPHGGCYLWRPDVLWLHVVSDTLTGLAYYSIPVALLVFLRRREDVVYHWMFLLFAAFIFACGTTHLFSVWNVWNAHYYTEGAVKGATAAVSVLTAILLWPLIPRAVALPSPGQLRESNTRLAAEVQRREAVERELREHQDTLEQRVEERTRALEDLNHTLEREVRERRAAEARFRQLFQASPDGMIEADAEGVVQLANPEAERIFGYDSDELIGRSVESLIPAGSREQHVEFRRSYARNPEARPMGQGRDLRGLRRDGREVPLVIGLSPITDGEDAGSVLASIIDISERKRLEQRLAANNQALRRSNAELEQFAFIASHDLREPLRKIQSFSNLLASGRYGRFDEQGNEFIGYITSAAERMEALLDSLLRYSRITSKAAPFEWLSLDDVLRAVQADLQLRLEERGAILEWASLPEIEADTAQMRQLVQNLVGNSLKYAREDLPPRIRISGEIGDDGLCRLTLSDNGIGFDRSYAEQIFEVFKRLHGRGVYEGTGMGLAICRKIVERHGGHIEADSAPGQGATFHITLPVTQGDHS